MRMKLVWLTALLFCACASQPETERFPVVRQQVKDGAICAYSAGPDLSIVSTVTVSKKNGPSSTVSIPESRVGAAFQATGSSRAITYAGESVFMFPTRVEGPVLEKGSAVREIRAGQVTSLAFKYLSSDPGNGSLVYLMEDEWFCRTNNRTINLAIEAGEQPLTCSALTGQVVTTDNVLSPKILSIQSASRGTVNIDISDMGIRRLFSTTLIDGVVIAVAEGMRTPDKLRPYPKYFLIAATADGRVRKKELDDLYPPRSPRAFILPSTGQGLALLVRDRILNISLDTFEVVSDVPSCSPDAPFCDDAEMNKLYAGCPS